VKDHESAALEFGGELRFEFVEIGLHWVLLSLGQHEDFFALGVGEFAGRRGDDGLRSDVNLPVIANGLPDIISPWLQTTGDAGKSVLRAYFDELRARGVKPLRDWDKAAR
jgi:hypothetical protein